MAHCVVPEAEAILDKEYPVLNHGFVRLVDYMGGDDRVVQAARVSYGAGTKTYREDSALIDYLLRHQHTSPFEQVQLTFHCKMPIFVARQWVRHRMARLNEVSGRYSVMKDEFYAPSLDNIALQSTDNRQGRASEPLPQAEAEAVLAELENQQAAAYASYKGLVDKGLARELARINLPLSVYTEWYWNIDMHNLFHFLQLRLDKHAQLEIRLYAQAMLEITAKVAPVCTAAFERWMRGSVTFSAAEMSELRKRLNVSTNDANGTNEELTGKALARFEKKLETGEQG
jgi:thymidylate synthase (FAD)